MPSTRCALRRGNCSRLQDIQVRIVHADAIASSSYLRSGQEDPAQRTAYLDEIGKAGDGLVAVSAAANSADLEQLSSASRLLGSYVGLVEQARANNRQGFPVGAAYQRQANGIVSNADPDTPDIVSSLRAVEESQRAQINDSLASAHRAGIWLNVTGGCCSPRLVVGSWWLWRTFRRVVNIPIAVALLALFLLLLIGGVKQAGAVSDADDAVGTQLAGADKAAQARAAAFEARSQEALTLINRGNGAANEVNWELGNDIVTREMSSRLGSDEGLSNAAASRTRAMPGRTSRSATSTTRVTGTKPSRSASAPSCHRQGSIRRVRSTVSIRPSAKSRPRKAPPRRHDSTVLWIR